MANPLFVSQRWWPIDLGVKGYIGYLRVGKIEASNFNAPNNRGET